MHQSYILVFLFVIARICKGNKNPLTFFYSQHRKIYNFGFLFFIVLPCSTREAAVILITHINKYVS